MPLPKIDATCTKCSVTFSAIPKRSFLGFQKLICPTCEERLTYPLTEGYRSTYQILFGIMILMAIVALSEGNMFYPGGFGIAIIYVLLRDRSIRKHIPTKEYESVEPDWDSGTNNDTKPAWKLGTIGGVILVIIIVGTVSQFIGRSATENYIHGISESELNLALIKAASDININLPMMVGSGSRLDKVTGSDRQMRYYYTMVNYTVNEMDANFLRDLMQPQLINEFCTTDETNFFMSNDVPITVAIYDKDGIEFLIMTILSSQCSGG